MLYRNGASAPLQGLRVLDLTRAVTGPFCTMILGDLGARIIKIEEPGTGDETRHWGPPFVEGESAYFLSLNRNKESVVLDFRQEGDLAALRRLAEKSDVVMQNFRPGVAERLQVDYRILSAVNPGLILRLDFRFRIDRAGLPAARIRPHRAGHKRYDADRRLGRRAERTAER